MASNPDASRSDDDDFGVLLGWSHAPFNRGIQIKLQSTRTGGPDPRDIATRTYLMTRNQALILAKYLLDTTDQTLPTRAHQGTLMRLLRRLTGG